MAQLDYVRDVSQFTALWGRAKIGVQQLASVPPAELFYFDPFDIVTPHLFGLVQTLLAVKGCTDFATVVLKPDPFTYFHHHFGKYPGFVHGRDNTYVELLPRATSLFF